VAIGINVVTLSVKLSSPHHGSAIYSVPYQL